MTYDLCTDRASNDLTELRRLLSLSMTQWTSGDWEIWRGDYVPFMAADGVYEAADGPILAVGTVDGVPTNRAAWNATDFNRVVSVMRDIYERWWALGFAPAWPASLPGTMDRSSTPGSYMLDTQLLANLRYIRDFSRAGSALPSSMSKLTLDTANRLEQCLKDIDTILLRREAGAQEMYCGDEICGGGW